jgi:hypothetical protein
MKLCHLQENRLEANLRETNIMCFFSYMQNLDLKKKKDTNVNQRLLGEGNQWKVGRGKETMTGGVENMIEEDCMYI